MKKLTLAASAAYFLTLAALAQVSNPIIPPGNLAVFKAGLPNNTYNISTARVQPCFVQIFSPTNANQAAPIVSVALPTNAPNGIWINAHAGSEGGGISRSADRHILALQGYTGNILSPTASKPSSNTNVFRGFGTLDAFTNEVVLYQDLASWFGMPPGVTQNNPTGIATADGTNFWGTGNVTGSSVEAAGTLFFNAQESPTPIELQNYIQAAAEARIIGGTLYVVVPGSGVFNFLDPANNDAVVPLPYDPNVPNPVEHIVLTNLFLNWGSTYLNIANFDMNPQGTIAYGADQTYGIVKFVNSGSGWTPAPYYFSATNIGTTNQLTANQGCFGICVDFSQTNPIIYATTMEYGTNIPANSQGNANNNRLISIVDTGVSPGTAMVATTLATATTTNEVFRGVDFSPDLRPQITSEPANYSTVAGGGAYFSVTANSVYSLGYQWFSNGGSIPNQTSSNLTLSGIPIGLDQSVYTCVVSNQYGMVTSTPATLTVTAMVQAPNITNTVANVSGFANGAVTFAPVYATGTEPFTYLWYFGGAQVSDGSKYTNSTTDALTIFNLTGTDNGNYYLVVSNSAGSASNLVDTLTVQYHLPVIAAGEPASLTAFIGQSATLTATSSGGTPPLTNQWYKGTNALSDGNEYSGSASSTLVINPAATNDAGSYKIVVSNPGGSITSSVATLTVIAAPPHTYVGYSNQVYFQNFNSLPDPGSNSVNSINNPVYVGAVNGIAYSLANPFDFGYPVLTTGYLGGLGLSNSMPGWYGAADTLYAGVGGYTRFAAQDGDQTTGGDIDFGPNDSGSFKGTNRALGLLSTGTTGSTTFALKLVNTSTNTLNTVSLSFTGELWHNGTTGRTMSFGYTLDPTATNFTLTAQSISNSVLVSNLFFSFPTAATVTTVDGTQSSNQVQLATNNMPLASGWTTNGALWLIWSIEYYGSGSGNGYAVDNLQFSAAPLTLALQPPQLGGVTYTLGSGPGAGLQFSFTNLPGASSDFSVWTTTNLNLPYYQWQNLGHPTETSPGNYLFLDSSATNVPQRFYQIGPP